MADPHFGEIRVDQIPEERLHAIRRQAFDASHDFFVSLVLNDHLLGSGTLVDAYGTLGILTAYHLAEQLDADRSGFLCSPLGEFPHRFEIPRQCIEHIPLGKPDPRVAADGPDLSFLRLLGEPLISILKGKKSFYRVSGKSFDELRALGPEKMFWWVIGAPAEISRPMTSKTDSGALMAKHLIAEAAFKSLTSRNDLETLTLTLKAGDHPFPASYQGASGGGVWVSSLMLDHPGAALRTIELSPCFLAGVMFYQRAVDTVNRCTEIVANGPRSIESLLERFRSAQ
jgi:hypothetical protein